MDEAIDALRTWFFDRARPSHDPGSVMDAPFPCMTIPMIDVMDVRPDHLPDDGAFTVFDLFDTFMFDHRTRDIRRELRLTQWGGELNVGVRFFMHLAHALSRRRGVRRGRRASKWDPFVPVAFELTDVDTLPHVASPCCPTCSTKGDSSELCVCAVCGVAFMCTGFEPLPVGSLSAT